MDQEESRSSPSKANAASPSAFRERYQSAHDEMLKMSELIADHLALLEAKEAKWAALERKLQENADHAANMVKLNVGGKIFCISKTHLLSVEGTYFHAMLGSGHWKPETDDGAYFIDRNPKQFDRVLDYLRTGELSFKGLRPDQSHRLKTTLDYLQIGFDDPEPEPAIALPVAAPVAWDPQMCGAGLSLSQENRVVVSGSSQWKAVRSVDPCVRFSVRLDSDGGTSYISIGFAPQARFSVDPQVNSSSGWYLYVRDGMIYSGVNIAWPVVSAPFRGGRQPRAVSSHTYLRRGVAVGSVVTCILDREQSSISFQVDGQSFGVAFTSVPSEDVYAALNIGQVNARLTLVD